MNAMFEAWGKARAADTADQAWHPLVYHCLDVAAVTEALLASRPVTRARAASLLRMNERSACELLVAFAALHDIGKFAAGFQAKAMPREWYWPSYCEGGYGDRHTNLGHTADGLLAWDAFVAEPFMAAYSLRSGRAWREIAAAVFGHHGRPIQVTELRSQSNVHLSFCAGTRHAVSAWVRTVCALLPPSEPLLTEPRQRDLKVASWWVAGLVTLSDWIGSNTSYFSYTPPNAADEDCRGYWAIARERAIRAVRDCGLITPASAPSRGYEELTGLQAPTPLQVAVQQVSLGDGPVLAIMEDATGAGKSEASHMLVHRLLRAHRVSGAFWAMPTQATADAMYARQAPLLARLFDDTTGIRPSLVLAHGKAHLHEAFSASVMDTLESSADPTVGDETLESELPSEVACPAFLADSRRKALLADIGVGTVDQAFLGVLPTRFNTLRLFAMAEKVLVLDEVHAFDEYMRAEAFALLQMHAQLGGSAILLSATLPASQRRGLVEVWRNAFPDADGDRGTAEADEAADTPYPLLTMVVGSTARIEQRTVKAPEQSSRDVEVRWLRTAEDCVSELADAHALGACSVWIRNSVAGCLEAAEAVRALGIEPLVFHSRFTPADRQRIEAQVMQRFGKNSSRSERTGQVLVATQVVEQSLDLDFDVMVSDLAPMDLLIQRAGRLWRHKRSLADRRTGSEKPVLRILAGSTDTEPDATWVSALGSRTEHIYGDLGLLWRTVKKLEASKEMRTPTNLRALIEAAYGDADVPLALMARTDRAIATGYSAGSIGRQNALVAGRGYGADGGQWSSDVHYPTRLGDPTATLRLARLGDDGRVHPWCEDDGLADWRRWAMSEVTLRRTLLFREGFEAVRAPDEYRERIDVVRSGWPIFERELPVVVLAPAGDGHHEGTIASVPEGRVARVRYSGEFGLEVSRP